MSFPPRGSAASKEEKLRLLPRQGARRSFQELAAEIRKELPGLSNASTPHSEEKSAASSAHVQSFDTGSHRSHTSYKESHTPATSSCSGSYSGRAKASTMRGPPSIKEVGRQETSQVQRTSAAQSSDARVANEPNAQQMARFLATLSKSHTDEKMSTLVHELNQQDGTKPAVRELEDLRSKVPTLERVNSELRNRIRELEQRSTADADRRSNTNSQAEQVRELQRQVAEERQRYQMLVVERDQMEEELQMELRKMKDSPQDDELREEVAHLRSELAQSQRDSSDLREEVSRLSYEYELLKNESSAVEDLRKRVRLSEHTMTSLEEENHDMSLELDSLHERVRSTKDRFCDIVDKRESQRLTGRCLRAWYLYLGQAIMRENSTVVAGGALHAMTAEKFKARVLRLFCEWRYVARCAALDAVMSHKTRITENMHLEASQHVEARDQAMVEIKRKEDECATLRAELEMQASRLDVERATTERLQEEMAHLASEYVGARSSVPEYVITKARQDVDELRKELHASEASHKELAREHDAVKSHHADRVRKLEESEAEALRRCNDIEAERDAKHAELHETIAQLKTKLSAGLVQDPQSATRSAAPQTPGGSVGSPSKNRATTPNVGFAHDLHEGDKVQATKQYLARSASLPAPRFPPLPPPPTQAPHARPSRQQNNAIKERIIRSIASATSASSNAKAERTDVMETGRLTDIEERLEEEKRSRLLDSQEQTAEIRRLEGMLLTMKPAGPCEAESGMQSHPGQRGDKPVETVSAPESPRQRPSEQPTRSHSAKQAPNALQPGQEARASHTTALSAQSHASISVSQPDMPTRMSMSQFARSHASNSVSYPEMPTRMSASEFAPSPKASNSVSYPDMPTRASMSQFAQSPTASNSVSYPDIRMSNSTSQIARSPVASTSLPHQDHFPGQPRDSNPTSHLSRPSQEYGSPGQLRSTNPTSHISRPSHESGFTGQPRASNPTSHLSRPSYESGSPGQLRTSNPASHMPRPSHEFGSPGQLRTSNPTSHMSRPSHESSFMYPDQGPGQPRASNPASHISRPSHESRFAYATQAAGQPRASNPTHYSRPSYESNSMYPDQFHGPPRANHASHGSRPSHESNSISYPGQFDHNSTGHASHPSRPSGSTAHFSEHPRNSNSIPHPNHPSRSSGSVSHFTQSPRAGTSMAYSAPAPRDSTSMTYAALSPTSGPRADVHHSSVSVINAVSLSSAPSPRSDLQHPRRSTPPGRTQGSGCGFGFEHYPGAREHQKHEHGDAVRNSSHRLPHSGFGPIPPLRT